MNLKRIFSFFFLAATATLLFAGATPALADDCGLLGGSINGSGECEISSAVARTGTYNLDETLHVTGAGRIDASNASHVGITLNICVAPATPSASCDLILDTPSPLVTPPAIGGGQIEADDLVGNDPASPITIHVSRDLLMGPNSAILADNTVSGGKAGTITITTGRDMTMNAVATISATGTGSAGNSPGGIINITVGNYPTSPGVGVFTMAATSQVLANSPQASAGAIAISAGDQMDINGLVQSSSRLSATTPATQAPGGGTITLISACELTVGDTGKVSSEGKDPGSDLVHLEGCNVTIYGVVQSLVVLAGGHALPMIPPNHCNLDTAAHPTFGPPSPPAAHPGRYTSCVEIWGNTVTIDSTGTHHGEVIADGVRTDTGGPMRSWIDIFAKSDITIIANTIGNYAVHANPDASTNDYAGLITIKSQGGKIVTTALVPGTKGLAVQSNGVSAGDKGGELIVQAGGASPNGQIDFTADSIQARGASSGGAPIGGHITVQSFNDTILGVAAGELNASGLSGTVTLTACVGNPATTYAGTVTGTETDNGPGTCGGAPSFPTVAHFLTGLTVTDLFTNRLALWTACTSLPTISGQKFNDLTGNGVKDGGDPGVSGFQIHILDKATSGATLHQDILTDANGNYTFTVPPGEYYVCEQGGPAPNSPAQTFPASDGSGGACATHTGVTGSRGYDIVLTVGLNVTGQDFGNFFGGVNGTISGQKFNDIADDGVKDAGDPPVPGLTIHLLDKATAGATVHQDTLTDASGNYSFTVPPGEYIICEQGGPAPASPAQTYPASDASGGACATHTSVTGSRGYDVVLGSGASVTGQDFGNYFAGSISGQKFNDLAGDGVKDAGDPPIAGVQIHLLDKATGGSIVHAHMSTDASGNYSFGSLQPGEYIVCEQGGPAPNSPAQSFPTSDASGGICATHTGVANSRGYDAVLTANGVVTGQDFGNYSGGTISGQKFNDLAGDGVKDASDPGVAGVQIHLLDKATGGSTVHLHMLTDVSGNYSFGALQPGEYLVCESGGPAPNSPAQTFPASDASGGVCATHTGVTGSRGYDVVLTANGTVTSQDFGNYFAGTISGHKFSDTNNNGVQDGGEPPIAGLQIHLLDKATSGATVHQDTSTDGSGNYSFTSLQPGEYLICEQGGPAPASPAQTLPASDASGGVCATHTGVTGSRGYDVVLGANQVVTGQDFGNYPGSVNGTISGQKFNDLSGNGAKDGGDPPVSGVQIHLLDKATSGATVHQHMSTDGSGNYSFSVPAGEYIVCEQGGPAPNSPAQTYPASDGSGGVCATHVGVTASRGYDLVLSAGQNVTGQDFGNFYGGTISGHKFSDLNSNGVNDGEPGMPGVQIHLFDKATGGTSYHQHQNTDANGDFSFVAVPPGEYILCEQGGPSPHVPAQTFPASDGSGGLCGAHVGVAGSRGYDIVLTANQTITGRDFGNDPAGPPPPPPGHPPNTIPTLGDFTLLALAALLGMSGALASRRRPRPRSGERSLALSRSAH